MDYLSYDHIFRLSARDISAVMALLEQGASLSTRDDNVISSQTGLSVSTVQALRAPRRTGAGAASSTAASRRRDGRRDRGTASRRSQRVKALAAAASIASNTRARRSTQTPSTTLRLHRVCLRTMSRLAFTELLRCHGMDASGTDPGRRFPALTTSGDGTSKGSAASWFENGRCTSQMSASKQRRADEHWARITSARHLLSEARRKRDELVARDDADADDVRRQRHRVAIARRTLHAAHISQPRSLLRAGYVPVPARAALLAKRVLRDARVDTLLKSVSPTRIAQSTALKELKGMAETVDISPILKKSGGETVALEHYLLPELSSISTEWSRFALSKGRADRRAVYRRRKQALPGTPILIPGIRGNIPKEYSYSFLFLSSSTTELNLE